MTARKRPRDVAAVLLWPGAGSSADHPSLVAIEEALAPLVVRRCDFPYRREGRRAPDRAPKLMAAVREEVAIVCEQLDVAPSRLVLGGRSMGGRIASMVVAEGLEVAGLVLIAYPLHPPGRPERLRTEHLGEIRVPSLWISGDRDPFGTPEELAEARSLVAGAVSAVTVSGRHDLRGRDAEVAAHLRRWVGVPAAGRASRRR